MAENRANRSRRRAFTVALLALGMFPLATTIDRAEAANTTCANGSYTIVSGDSWSGIASRHKVSLSSLLQENAASSTTIIYPGRSLCLPVGATVPTTAATTVPTSMPTGSATVPSNGCANGSHTVASGNSWSGIAARYGVSLNAVLSENSASVSTMLYPGRTVCLPVGAASTTTTTVTPPPASTRIVQFPVQGPCWYSDSWHAPRGGGRLHEGVDVIARSGQYVYAADDGVLTIRYIDAPGRLAGNGWRLTRADGTYFFYAHLSAFASGLEVGSEVVAGQVIGFVGSTGNSSTAHLHFEIHPNGGAAVNPTPAVKAVDGCNVSAVPPQPGGVTPPSPAAAPTTTSTVPSSTPTAGTPMQLAPAVSNARWNFFSPVRALDARVASGGRSTIKIANLAGISTSTPSVMVRLSATGPAGSGFVALHPCDVAPTTSTLSIVPGRVNSATSVVAVRGGSFCISSSVAANLRADVIAAAGSGVGVQPIVARRALDTRTATALTPGSTRTISLGSLGVPKGSRAVTASFTIVDAASDGTLSIGPCGAGSWGAAYGATPLQSFSLTVRVNDSGLCVRTSSTVHLVVDATAAWTGTSGVAAIGPTRALDTRGASAIGWETRAVDLAGVTGGAKRVMATVTAIGGAIGSAVYAWPCASGRPVASIGATPAGKVTAFGVVIDGNQLCLSATSFVDVVVDVTAAG
jgi:murein DD-endopeptidase MepM/ murein hydrolase activator NlpD